MEVDLSFLFLCERFVDVHNACQVSLIGGFVNTLKEFSSKENEKINLELTKLDLSNLSKGKILESGASEPLTVHDVAYVRFKTDTK